MEIKPLISFSAAVVCYNSPSRDLRKLFTSLFYSIEKLRHSFELPTILIYLIDNSNENPLEIDSLNIDDERIKFLNIELRLLQGQGNVGYGSAHNLVISKLTSQFHLLLNPDVVLEKEALITGISFLRKNQKVALASPYAEDGKGDKQYLCKRYPTVFTFLIRGVFPKFLKKIFTKRLANYEMHDLSERGSSVDIPITSGCFMLLRSKTLTEIGGFDERYFLYFEDFDLSLRLGKRGQLAYLPAMRIQHKGGEAGSKGFKHFKMFARSGVRFFNTYGWRFIHR